MTPVTTNTLPLVPWWLRAWAILTVVVLFLLLGLGSIVTTFRVGMEDPIWPTTPWHLFVIDWTEPSRGYLIEHAHRLAAFATGGIMAVLTFFVWLREPRPGLRWTGFVALVGLLFAFGFLHRDLMKQSATEPFHWPASGGATLIWFALAVGCALVGLRSTGGGVRLGVILVLGAVMVQGLFGGLRVRLNAWFGTDLAALHGVVAQLIFAVLMGLTVVLCARQRPPAESVGGGIRTLAWGCVALLVVQLIWGAVLRQTGWTTMQRLHFLTAFAALAGIVWLIVAVASRRAAWVSFGGSVVVLGVLVALQVMLGVETWFSKFSQGVAPELQMPVTTAMQATIRTLHVLIGAVLLAIATALAMRANLVIRAAVTAPVTMPPPEKRQPVESWA
jgi:heme A synthase